MAVSKKKRTYSLRLIKADYSYTTEQIADLFGIDVATVRRWIREEGLHRIPRVRPHLVHSTDLKAFLEKRQAKKKKTCTPDEIFCLKCQQPRRPEMSTVKAVKLPNASFRIQAKCSVCHCKMNRAVRQSDWHENHPLAEFLGDAKGEHNGVQSMPLECSFHKEKKSCPNITP